MSKVKNAPTFRKLSVSSLQVFHDDGVQRAAPSKDKVMEIVHNFDWAKLGTLTVSERANGDLSVIDGQRRLLALRQMGMDTSKVGCSVHQGLTKAEEADKFLGLNNYRVVNAVAKFLTGVTAKDPECVGIRDVCASHGVTVSKGSNLTQPTHTNAVQSLRKVWRIDGEGKILDKTIRALHGAFGKEPNSLCGHLIEGVGRMVAKNGVDTSVLVDKIQRRFPAPSSVISVARGRRDSEGGSLAANVEAVLEKTYKSRRRQM